MCIRDRLYVVDQYVNPARVYIGDDLVTPSWSDHDIHTVDPDLASHECSVVDAGAVLKFLYQRKGFPISDIVLEICLVEYDGGSFTSPVVYWDVGGNPPPAAIGDPNDFQTQGMIASLEEDLLAVGLVMTADEFDTYQSVAFVSTPEGSGTGIGPDGIESEEAWGDPSLSGSTLVLGGIESEEAWGRPTLGSFSAITPTGIPGAESWGLPRLNGGPSGTGST